MLTYTLLVVPVAKVVVLAPKLSPNAVKKFASVAPVHVLRTGATVSVRLAVGAAVIRRVSVAVSAPPVVGIAQLARLKRTNVHRREPAPGLTLSVVPALLSPYAFSSLYVSVATEVPVSVHELLVSGCDPAQRCHELMVSVAAKAVDAEAAAATTKRRAKRRMLRLRPLRTGSSTRPRRTPSHRSS
jgi:hypothetical protein